MAAPPPAHTFGTFDPPLWEIYYVAPHTLPGFPQGHPPPSPGTFPTNDSTNSRSRTQFASNPAQSSIWGPQMDFSCILHPQVRPPSILHPQMENPTWEENRLSTSLQALCAYGELLKTRVYLMVSTCAAWILGWEPRGFARVSGNGGNPLGKRIFRNMASVRTLQIVLDNYAFHSR